MPPDILVVDDDRKTVDLVRLYLERERYRVRVAYDGEAALAEAHRLPPDLIVLDLMLPGLDGLTLCRLLQERTPVPIIMLTARTTEEDKLRGLGLGADDYITKPFSPRELVARVRAVLRRTAAESEQAPPEVRYRDLAVHFPRHEVRLRGAPVRLTPKEFRLLETLARAPGRAFSRSELLDRVFGLDYEGLERTVDVHVRNLRKKIEANPDRPVYVQTVYGLGYKFGGDDVVP
jgi:DNA-binding response OmpR family regulator